MLSSNRLLIYLKSNGTASYSTLKCVFCVRMSVFVLVCVIPPTATLPNSIRDRNCTQSFGKHCKRIH